MKQSHIVAFAMNLLNIMSTIVITNHLGIPMMVITVINLPELSFGSSYYSMNNTRTQQIPDRTLFIPQYQSLCNKQFSRKAGGQITIHEQ